MPAIRRRCALVAAGTELRPFPRAVLEPCFYEAYKFYDELAAKDPKFKKIYDSLKTFRSDENLWFRVAENTFDNFNLRDVGTGPAERITSRKSPAGWRGFLCLRSI